MSGNGLTTSFLSLASEKGFLTIEQIGNVLREHQDRARVGIPLRTGDVAVEQGYMNEDAVATVIEAQESGEQVPDILEQNSVTPTIDGDKIRRRLRFTLVMFTVAAIPLCGFLFKMEMSLGNIGGLASIFTLVWTVLEVLTPRLLRIHITVTGYIRWAAIPLALTFFFYAIWELESIESATVTATPEVGGAAIEYKVDAVAVALLRLKITLVATLALTVCMALSSFWRHFQIQSYISRSNLSRGLVKVLEDCVFCIDGNDNRSELDLDKWISRILDDAIEALALNPWRRLVRKLVFWSPGTGALSIWYLEPSKDGQCFDVRLYETCSAPKEIGKAFDIIKEKHHPVMLDLDKYRQVVNALKTKGSDIKNGLLNDQCRANYLSLAGWVFHYRRGLESGNAKECAALDPSYRQIALANLPKTKVTADWLEFNSFAAYPVFIEKGKPAGVLIAFSDLLNAFTQEDRNLLVSTARVVGALQCVAKHRIIVNRSEEDCV